MTHQLALPAGYQIGAVKYFTARVSGAENPNSPREQHAYLRALGTLPEVKIYYGRFLPKTIWRPLVNLPVAGATIQTNPPVSRPAGLYPVSGGSLLGTANIAIGQYPPKGQRSPRKKNRRPPNDPLIVEVHSMEEKGSDVNLAAHLLNDAWKNSFDSAVVISNDTDLTTPIEMVSIEMRKPVTVACPGRWTNGASPRTSSQLQALHSPADVGRRAVS